MAESDPYQTDILAWWELRADAPRERVTTRRTPWGEGGRQALLDLRARDVSLTEEVVSLSRRPACICSVDDLVMARLTAASR
jgi:hypothetical protein